MVAAACQYWSRVDEKEGEAAGCGGACSCVGGGKRMAAQGATVVGLTERFAV
jgi:hypothetical protein